MPPLTELFRAGTIRFFPSDSVCFLLERGRCPSDAPAPDEGFLISDESDHHYFFPRIQNRGGLHLGVGSFQNLAMAAHARASGIIFVDAEPQIPMTLPLLLPLLGPRSFVEAACRMVQRGVPMEPYLRVIPDAYRGPFQRHIEILRRNTAVGCLDLRDYLERSSRDRRTFLGNREYFDHIVALLLRGAVGVVYGDLFEAETLEVIEGIAAPSHDPVRTIYLSNASTPVSKDPFLRFLRGPQTDPDGILLATAGGSSSFAAKRRLLVGPKAKAGYSYFAVPIRTAAELLAKRRSI